MKKNKTLIIPLGQNCMPRTILTRWGLKPKKLLGEKTYPFDLAVFETREITHSIKTNFEEFLYNLNYREDSKIWAKEPDCIEFTHDKIYKKEDKEKLIKKYLERIENFENAISDEEDILFVQILGDCNDVENLYSELSKIRGDKPFKLAIIDTENIVQETENIHVLKLPYPSEEYKQNWWKKEYYSSEIGKKFEKSIVDFCKNLIE